MRRFVAAAWSVLVLISACGDDDAALTTTAGIETTVATTVSPTTLATTTSASTDAAPSSCTPPALTAAQTEGPYYTPDTPERTSLREEGGAGTPLLLTGVVLTVDCRPVAGAWLDFWQADGDGTYDNSGYAFRGHQYTDAEGRYRLEAVVPGLYPGRTRHIHVKVQAPGGPVLTTQLYFPDEPANAGDGFFDPLLVMDYDSTSEGATGTFDFVVAGS